MSTIEIWTADATRAVGEGRWQDAERLWRRVLDVDPSHAQALYSIGVHAFQRGLLTEALSAMQAANAASPRDPMVLLSIGRVKTEQGDFDGALDAIDASLTADPYFLPALLAKADLFERKGQMKAAMAVYRNALKVAPPESGWPVALRPQLQRGHALVQRFGVEFSAFLAERAGTRVAALTPMEAERWREAGAILGGQSRAYPSVCNQLQVPRLPAIPFFDRSQFAWVDAVEQQTAQVTAELKAVLAGSGAGFKPYVAYAPDAPVNQWKELNHSTRWSSYALWTNGSPVQEHLQQCPVTAAMLRDAGQADIDGMCPNAMFSALAPHTHIPPHHGDTNARVVVHLPLVVPEGCRYRVGYEHRRWTVGEVLIFDDSIEHEARNDSDELRVVLIFDVWNPLLSEGEREMVRFLTKATHAFEFGGPHAR